MASSDPMARRHVCLPPQLSEAVPDIRSHRQHSSDAMPEPERRFPPPWSVDDPDMKLGQDCFIIRDRNGQALARVYFEGEPGRRSAAHLLTRDEAGRIAVNIRQAAGAECGDASQKSPGGP
jgi:hypothetical protein